MWLKPLEIDNIPGGREVDFRFTVGRVLDGYPPKGEEEGTENIK
jgi:hypothetical protein